MLVRWLGARSYKCAMWQPNWVNETLTALRRSDWVLPTNPKPEHDRIAGPAVHEEQWSWVLGGRGAGPAVHDVHWPCWPLMVVWAGGVVAS